MRRLLALALVCLCTTSQAVTKCTDARGHVTYQDSPCSAPSPAVVRGNPIPARKAMSADEVALQRKAILAKWEAELPAALAARDKAREERAAMDARADSGLDARVMSDATPMPFERCLSIVRATILSSRPHDVRNVVVGRDLTITRFCTVDGSVLVTCSRLDGRMVTTKSGRETASAC